MQEYLARMNKQLQEMAAQHQLVRPAGCLQLLQHTLALATCLLCTSLLCVISSWMASLMTVLTAVVVILQGGNGKEVSIQQHS